MNWVYCSLWGIRWVVLRQFVLLDLFRDMIGAKQDGSWIVIFIQCGFFSFGTIPSSKDTIMSWRIDSKILGYIEWSSLVGEFLLKCRTAFNKWLSEGGCRISNDANSSVDVIFAGNVGKGSSLMMLTAFSSKKSLNWFASISSEISGSLVYQ